VSRKICVALHRRVYDKIQKLNQADTEADFG